MPHPRGRRQLRRPEVSPAIIGINYYLTSDRFLDHRLDRYPAVLHGERGAKPEIGEAIHGGESGPCNPWRP